jgi:hypothetical protein
LGSGAEAKAGEGFGFDGSAAKPEVQWIEADIACRAKPRCVGDGMELELLGGGARLRIRDERDAGLAAVMLAIFICSPIIFCLNFWNKKRNWVQ